MSWYVADAIDRAFGRTKKCLLETFDFWKWMKLAIIVLLIGGSGFNGGSGSNYSFDDSDISSVTDIPAGATNTFQQASGWFSSNMLEIAFVLIILFILLVLLFSYISSVMEFVLVESLVKNDVRFWEYSRRYLSKGFGLFLLRLLLALFLLVIIAAVTLPFIYAFIGSPASTAPGFTASNVFIFLLLLFALIFILAIVGGVVGSLIGLSIPVALYTGNNIFRAFTMVLRNFRRDPWQIVLYWIGRIVLSLVVAVIVGIAALIVVILAVLIALVINGLLYLVLTALWPGSSVVWIVLAPLIFIQLVILILAIAFVSMPGQVFLRYHLLTFLQLWYPEITIPVFDDLKSTGYEDAPASVQTPPQ
jgi:hypothetical protein